MCPTVNVALKKPANQQNPWTHDDTFDASNAVDGRYANMSWTGGQCAVSYGSQTATLWVNLTSVYDIHHITIYYLTNNLSWGMLRLNFIVDKTITEKTPISVLTKSIELILSVLSL